jgi:hypothetical protein
MGASVFVFTLGAFLKVDRKAFSVELNRPLRATTVLVWTLAGVPALAWALVKVLDLPPKSGWPSCFACWARRWAARQRWRRCWASTPLSRWRRPSRSVCSPRFISRPSRR